MKYFMREVKKGEIASQLFNDKQLLLPLQKEFCLEKRFMSTHFLVQLKEDSF